VPAAYGVLAVAQFGFFWLWFFWPSMSIQGLDTMGVDTLPARWGDWQRGDYSRGWVGHYGAFFSQTWSYRVEKHSAVVSLDYPFQGWHELTGCYVRIGWAVEEQSASPPDPAGGGEGPYIAEVKLSKSLDQHAYLLYSLFGAQGRPVKPAESSPEEGWLQVLRRRAPGGQQGAASCQVQLLVQSTAPLTPAEQSQAKEFFRQVWSLLRAHCTAAQEGSP
jgi:hypothetical protein